MIDHEAATMVFLDENGFNFNNWVRRGEGIEGHSHEEIAMGKHRSWLFSEHFFGTRWLLLKQKMGNPVKIFHFMGNMVIHQWWSTNGDPPMVFFLEGIHSIVRLDSQAMFVGKIVLNFPADMASDGSDPLMRRTIDRLVVGQPVDPGWTGWT